jgi:arginine decarboxylase
MYQERSSTSSQSNTTADATPGATPVATPWSPKKSKELYGIETWGRGYFDINDKGNVNVCPMGENGPKVDLLDLTNDLKERGIRTPMLLRFTDITKERIKLLNQCFANAINNYNYKGRYQGVYPIKVNQQRHLVQEIINFGETHSLGLECGSKPELLVVLAMLNNPKSIVICNGFKDAEYIETAILSRKLGRNTLIVVERLEELALIIKASKKFSTRPKIGLRAKLQSKGSGRWVDSGGDRSKFGLTTSEIFTAFETLKKEDLLNCLDLVHFHVGSQVPSIKEIKSALKEGVQIYSELHKMGAYPSYLDVGGGLGIDYDGTGASDSSVNYTEQEYANDVVALVQSICEEKNVPMPTIVTESGRATVAHHSILIFDVLGVNKVEQTGPLPEIKEADHKVVHELRDIFNNLKIENLREHYNDLNDLKENTLQLFTFGLLTLAEKAIVERLFWSISTKMAKLVENDPDHEDIKNHMREFLSDTYFCNFSVFQSLPDSWAVDQIFPVMPIHKHLEQPNKQSMLVDLTCDSDGKIANYLCIPDGVAKSTLPVHEFKVDQPYYMGAFLVGAYQEILGDLHNLFGDTDAVHVSISSEGYQIEHVVEGDTVAEVLSYVQYNREDLLNKIRKASETSIINNTMTKQEARLLIQLYQEGLSGYTYLEEPDHIFGA